MTKKYFIKTYGCQMNKSDEERIAGLLENIGYGAANKMERAELVVFVACSVRQSAMDRIYGQARHLRQLKTDNLQPTTILTGCLLEKDKEALAEKFDLVFNIKDLPKLPELMASFKAPRPKITPLKPKADYFHINPSHQSSFSACVPIMTGCDNYCSYCVVPYARGPEISRPADEIIGEIRKLAEKGYREITLLGQNVNSYRGKRKVKSAKRKKAEDNQKYVAFPELLRSINDIPGDFWLRFVTSHPKDMTGDLIKTMAKCEKACHYIHLPAQAGDNEILKKMNRHYTVGHYKKLIEKIRKAIPGAAISTDIIVGFPGETEKQFLGTARLMEETGFDMAYVARYSPRKQTAAYRLKDDVPGEEKKRREKILNEILKKTALKNNRKYVGREVGVLIEQMARDYYYGKTRTFKNVRIGPAASKQSRIKSGDLAKVKITKAAPWGLEGKLIE